MAIIEFVCPKCDSLLKVDESGAGLNVNCPGCKAMIQIPLPQSNPDPVQSRTHFFCPHCGIKIVVESQSIGASFCPHCGKGMPGQSQASAVPSSVAQMPQSIGSLIHSQLKYHAADSEVKEMCPQCKSELTKDAVLCINCGTDLRTGKKITLSSELETKSDSAGKAAIPLNIFAVAVYTFVVFVFSALLIDFIAGRPSSSSQKAPTLSSDTVLINENEYRKPTTSGVVRNTDTTETLVHNDAPPPVTIAKPYKENISPSVSVEREKEYQQLLNTYRSQFRSLPQNSPVTLLLTSGGSFQGTLIAVNSTSVTIALKQGELSFEREQLDIATRQLLFAEDYAERLLLERVGTDSRFDTIALNNAMNAAKASEFYEEAIEIVEKAINMYPSAPANDIAEAKSYLARLIQGYNEFSANTEKGLVLFNNRWMTPSQAENQKRLDYQYARQQEEQAREQRAPPTRYGSGGIGHNCYGSYTEASRRAGDLNRNTEGWSDSVREQSIDAARSGGESTFIGSPAMLNQYRVGACEIHTGKYTVEAYRR